MDDHDRNPEPQTFGALEPPRRRPPTAVGVLTPPPPPESDEAEWYPMANRMRLIAQAILSVYFAAGGLVLARMVESPAATIAGSVIVIVGGNLCWRVAADFREEERLRRDRTLHLPSRRQRAA
jgi:hypothetical protein